MKNAKKIDLCTNISFVSTLHLQWACMSNMKIYTKVIHVCDRFSKSKYKYEIVTPKRFSWWSSYDIDI